MGILIFLGVLIALSILIIAHEWGHFFAARKLGVRVEEFGFGFPPRIISTIRKGTRYSLNALPLGGYVKLFGEHEIPETADKELLQQSFTMQAVWKRIVIVVAGIVMNLFLGWLILSTIFFIGTRHGVLVTQVLPDSPGGEAGIMANDILLGYETTDQFLAAIQDHAGETFSLTIERGGNEQTLSVTPSKEVIEGRGRVGVGVTEFGFSREPIFQALKSGFLMMLFLAGNIILVVLGLLQALFGLGGGSVASEVSGPVGIFVAAYSAGSLGFMYILQLIGVISVNLAVLNLLPIPGLDGGRLLFLVIEKLRRKRVSPRREALIHGIGVMVLIALILIVTFRDIARLL